MKKVIKGILTFLLCFALVIPVYMTRAEESKAEFYLEEPSGEIQLYSFDNNGKLPVSGVRYDKFRRWDPVASTSSYPNMGMGMKYIVGDDKNPDGGGKWRYVYCLEFSKDSPEGGLSMEYVGWANRQVSYALYYGAVYYGYPCRYAPYSTGDWQMDYYVTQAAIHILNGEFTLAAMQKGMNASNATQAEKNLAYDRINRLVSDAQNPGNYGGFTSDGWLDMNHCTFSLEGYQDSWYYDNGKYLSGGKFKANFKSYYGYDFREQITDYAVQVPQEASVKKNGIQTYADFQVAVGEGQYKKWQLTGYTVPVNVKVSLPRYWGGGIYKYRRGENIQKVCFLTWGTSGGTSTFSKSVQLHIQKVKQNLKIYKTDGETGAPLSGAKFSLWAYDGKNYSKKAGDFSDNKDGSYTCVGIDYTQTVGGYFLIREDQAPETYDKKYICENSADENDYAVYGGREIRMNENGFYSEKTENPLMFRDKKLIPQANLEVMKYDIDTGENLEAAEFCVSEWDKTREKYKEESIQKLEYDPVTQLFKTKSPLVRTEENQGKFMVKETKLPQGYHCPWSQEILVEKPGVITMQLKAPNYPGRTITVTKRILREEITWEHGNPVFFFRITGKDRNGESHGYHCWIELRQEMMEQQEGEYLVGTARVTDIPAGMYEITELEDTSRYVLTDIISQTDNVSVDKKLAETVNGIQKLQGKAMADLEWKDGSILFENRKTDYKEYSDTAVAVNHFQKTGLPKEP